MSRIVGPVPVVLAALWAVMGCVQEPLFFRHNVGLAITWNSIFVLADLVALVFALTSLEAARSMRGLAERAAATMSLLLMTTLAWLALTAVGVAFDLASGARTPWDAFFVAFVRHFMVWGPLSVLAQGIATPAGSTLRDSLALLYAFVAQLAIHPVSVDDAGRSVATLWASLAALGGSVLLVVSREARDP